MSLRNRLEKNFKYIIIFFIILFLLIFSFQIGFIYGSKIYQPCEIKIFKNGNN
ncbi:MAG: hypothetical protein KatS3mg095_0152 [Candidatus Parcubacteria bacterium]|nr:MAG: hypothetical protein KatS3mg095_0152 [Candidatus Parcubacteria bacterium]